MGHAATERLEKGALAFGLDTFRERIEIERPGERDDRPNQFHVGIVGLDTGDEGAVDLDAIDRKMAEIGEAGITGAEIVDRNLDTEIVELVEDRDGTAGIRHRRGFRDLDLERVGRKILGLERVPDLGDEARIGELDRRNVDGDASDRRTGVTPEARLPTGLAQGKIAERMDQPEFLGERDELVRPPRAGSRARISASTATIAPVARSTCGW